MIRPLLLLAALMLCPTAGAAEIVKCTDSNGTVTYQKTPCPQESEAERLGIRSRPADPEAQRARAEERRERLDEANELREQKALSAEARAEEEALRKRKCEQARSNAQRLELARRVAVDDGGERRYMTESELAERKRLNQQRISEFCN